MVNAARHAAFRTLLRIEKERSYADVLIDRELKEGRLTGADRGLYTELVYGSLRQQGALDHIISQFSRSPVSRLERAVHVIIRLGLYQMFFLDRVPVSAAVNEAVNLANEIAPKAAGFINAVLRSADRGRADIRYPDPGNEPAAYIAAKHSHPQWLVEKWLAQLGFDEAEQLAVVMSSPPPFTIRVNRLKTNRDELLNRLVSEGLSAIPCRYAPDGIIITSSASLSALSSFHEGLFTVQNEASQLAVMIMDTQPGDHILDVCAAPGGKATYLAELTGNSGSVVACDRNMRKLRLISETAARLGLKNIVTTVLDGTKPLDSLPERKFDQLLVDAPCSGLGVIHHNPEGKWWKSPTDPERLAVTQLAILENAATMLKLGGILLYATCSTTETENEQVIDEFLKGNPEFMIEPVSSRLKMLAEMETERGFFRSWPHRHGMDGFFAARLRKITGDS
jgi:16S rRNA (cytosine967-C5)-methyltransferase